MRLRTPSGTDLWLAYGLSILGRADRAVVNGACSSLRRSGFRPLREVQIIKDALWAG